MSATKKMWGDRFGVVGSTLGRFFQNEAVMNVIASIIAVLIVVGIVGGMLLFFHWVFNDPEVDPQSLTNSSQCEAQAIDQYLASGNSLRKRQYGIIQRACTSQDSVNLQRAAIKDKL